MIHFLYYSDGTHLLTVETIRCIRHLPRIGDMVEYGHSGRVRDVRHLSGGIVEVEIDIDRDVRRDAKIAELQAEIVEKRARIAEIERMQADIRNNILFSGI